MNTKIHTDIKSDSKIIQFFAPKWQPYAVLARLDRPIGVWLLLLPGLWGIVLASGGIFAMSFYGWFVCLVFVAGSVVMRAAGCVINDLWDKDLDAKVQRTRTRPIASGEVSTQQALIFLMILLWIGLCLLMFLSPSAIALGFLSIPLIVTYPLMKRFTWWPQAFLGITFNFSAMIGWASIADEVGFSGLLLYLSGIFWTLGYDTIYAHQDKEDDALVGIKSTARYFQSRSKTWITAFYVLSWVLLAVAVFWQNFSILAVLCLLPAGAHLFLQIARWQMDDAESALRTFKSNRNYGLLVLLAVAFSGLL